MEIQKMFVLALRRYADFDMPYDTPIAVSSNKDRLENEAVELNAKRTKEQLRNEEGYYVLPNKVKVL